MQNHGERAFQPMGTACGKTLSKQKAAGEAGAGRWELRGHKP